MLYFITSKDQFILTKTKVFFTEAFYVRGVVAFILLLQKLSSNRAAVISTTLERVPITTLTLRN